MDSEQVVVVAAASIGAALAVNVAAVAAVEVLVLSLEGIEEEEEEEDRRWTMDRLQRLRLRSCQLPQESFRRPWRRIRYSYSTHL